MSQRGDLGIRVVGTRRLAKAPHARMNNSADGAAKRAAENFLIRVGVGVFAELAAGPVELFSGDLLFHIFAGGLILGAFFMATDMVTSPITPKGRVIFALGCGVLTAVIRKMGGYPEGVCYSILIMNTCVPLIDRFTKPRRFGTVTFYEPPAAQADAAS